MQTGGRCLWPPQSSVALPTPKCRHGAFVWDYLESCHVPGVDPARGVCGASGRSPGPAGIRRGFRKRVVGQRRMPMLDSCLLSSEAQPVRSRQPRLPVGARWHGLRAVASAADAGPARRMRLSSGGRARRSRATQGCPVLRRPDRPRAPPGNGPSPLPAADTSFQPGLRARPSAASPHPALCLNEGRDEIPPSVSAALGAPSPPPGNADP